jgi:hypothetical protein
MRKEHNRIPLAFVEPTCRGQERVGTSQAGELAAGPNPQVLREVHVSPFHASVGTIISMTNRA